MQIEKNILLKEFTSLRVGGSADFFVRVRSGEEMQKALEFAKEKNLPVCVFGGGSNLLFADDGFRGLVVKNEIQNVEFKNNVVKVGSGVPLAALVMESARRNLSGLEQLAGVPGTVGGAVVGNANEIGENVLRVHVLRDGEEKVLEKKDLEFSYRDSSLREEVVTEVELELATSENDLQQEASDIAREKIMKQPYDGTAGSWFKNPPDQKAWELIEQAGCRDLKVGDAVISQKHANFFQNSGEATTADFLALEKMVVEKVEEKFGVRLEREVVVVGESA